MRLRPLILVLCAAACTRPSPPPAAVEPRVAQDHALEMLGALDTARILAAAIDDRATDPPRPRGAVALGRHWMPGELYSSGGLLSDSVIAYLSARKLFSELCGEIAPGGRVPVCRPREAPVEIRFSRPIFMARDTMEVYVGTGSVRPANDTTSVYFATGYTLRCRVVYAANRWKRLRCWETMVI